MQQGLDLKKFNRNFFANEETDEPVMKVQANESLWGDICEQNNGDLFISTTKKAQQWPMHIVRNYVGLDHLLMSHLFLRSLESRPAARIAILWVGQQGNSVNAATNENFINGSLIPNMGSVVLVSPASTTTQYENRAPDHRSQASASNLNIGKC